jgi:uroporphyrinogen-III decarboxylase
LARAHIAAYATYGHEPIVVGIDVYNVEAEAYGAELVMGGLDELPHLAGPIVRGPCDIKALPAFDPEITGRMPVLLRAAQVVREACPHAELCVPMCGPVTLAAQLMGIETLLCAAYEEPFAVQAVLRRLANAQLSWYAAIRRLGLRAVVFESAASPPLFSPHLFRQIVAPTLRAMLQAMRELGGEQMPLVMGGDMAEVAETLLPMPVRAVICPAETDQTRFLRVLAARKDVSVRVNMRAGLIASPTWAPIQTELDRVMLLARTGGRSIIGTGVVPYHTSPDNIRRAQAYVADA